MRAIPIPSPQPFHFRDVVFSHGWLRLPPFYWSEETGVLARIERLPSGGLCRIELSAAPGGVLARTAIGPAGEEWLVGRVRWMLALDEDLEGFHALCRTERGLRAAAERGKGRMLRCPTVWEELVKTLFCLNTTWRQSVAMAERLAGRYGEPLDESHRAFPEPERVAGASEAELQQECRLGYRAAPLLRLAREIAEGCFDPEVLKDPSLPDEELGRRLRALPGFGPYAAANVMLLLGRYDHLPIDSWFRRIVGRAWFEGREVTDRELAAAFERFRPYRTLAYQFYEWGGAAEEF